MRLFDAILDANHRAVSGDNSAGVRAADYTDELPVVALTCIDPRLNRFFPGVLGLPDENFIWLRNAGNIITSPLSSTMRSLALACAIKGGREIAIIGHTDCRVRHTTVSQLIDRFKAMGIERQMLPENLTEYFGIFASEHQNVLNAVDIVRRSPLIGRNVNVHGLMVDTANGKLEWIANGYDILSRPATFAPVSLQMPSIGATAEGLLSRATAEIAGGLKMAETKIGEAGQQVSQWAAQMKPVPSPAPAPAPAQAPPPPPAPLDPRRRVPVPPRIEPPQKPAQSKFRL